jgi:periplasmic protein TonB
MPASMQTFDVDDNLRRWLPWLTGSAIMHLTMFALMDLLRLVEHVPATAQVPPSIEVQLVEAPAAVSAPQSVPAPAVPILPQRMTRARTPEPKPAPMRSVPEPQPVATPSVDAPAAPPSQPDASTAVIESPTVPVGAQSSSSVADSANASSTPTSQSDRPMTAAVSRQGRPGGEELGSGRLGARAIFQPLPQIPDDLRRADLDLMAIARFRVASNGTATVELIQPTSNLELNRALLETLKRWRFFPAIQDGKAVASTIDIRIPISVK